MVKKIRITVTQTSLDEKNGKPAKKSKELYLCEFDGCGNLYSSKKDAEKCQSLEVQGPIINPGLLLKRNMGVGDQYLIIHENTVQTHYRIYHFMNLRKYHFDLIEECPDEKDDAWPHMTRHDKINPLHLREQFSTDGNISYSLLEDEEFEKINDLIMKANATENIRSQFRFYRIQTLYNKFDLSLLDAVEKVEGGISLPRNHSLEKCINLNF